MGFGYWFLGSGIKKMKNLENIEILQNLAMFMIFGSPFVFIAGLIVTAVNKTNKKNRIVFGSWFGYRLYNWF